MSEQQPSAEMPQPQQSFGSAPGGQETMGQAPPPAEAAPKKKRGFGRWAIWLVVVVVVAGVGWFLARDEPANANVGDCLAGTTTAELNADDLKIAKCDDPGAGFRVVQKVEDKTYDESQDACTDPSSEYVFWSGKEGQKGTVLCLATTKK